MNDDRLTPEERAVIEAAQAWRGDWPAGAQQHPPTTVSVLRDAVDAYRKAAATPEPFEGYVFRFPDTGRLARVLYESPDGFTKGAEVWCCTVTPVERVR